MSARKTSPAIKTAQKRKATVQKKTSRKTSLCGRLLSLVWSNKLIAVLVVVVVILLGALINQKYQDWDNAQMIKGLARDFPTLVAEIESATGLDLEVKYECMKTQEKFADGVNVCELSASLYGVDEANVAKYIATLENSKSFKRDQKFQNNRGYDFLYRNKKSCDASYKGVSFGCLIGVKDKNIQLATEQFNQ